VLGRAIPRELLLRHVDLLLANIDLDGRHPEAPDLRQGANCKEIAVVGLRDTSLVKVGLSQCEITHILHADGFGVIEMQPAYDNTFGK
jgi:hypothetical protein